MTDTDAAAPEKRASGLNTMLLAELKTMASGLGISGAGTMKKAQLVDAIKQAQAGKAAAKAAAKAGTTGRAASADKAAGREAQDAGAQKPRRGRTAEQSAGEGRAEQSQSADHSDHPEHSDHADQGGEHGRDDGEGSRRNRRRRGRDRDRDVREPGRDQQRETGRDTGRDSGRDSGRDRNRGQRHDPDTTILEDDVLVPAAGILDVLDNYAFVRTSGYLPGSDDVYLSLSMVRKYGLRRGDALVGDVRQPREGESRAKFNPMVRINSVNGTDPELTRNRPEFSALTPVHPAQRLRLETDAANLAGRVIDVVAPIGKGQRGLIVSPARAGKTTLLQSLSAAITANNPECHLMVVLVDERPEEVTAFERLVKGEVIASTFDRPPADHTTVAELAIERAKRLVELGHDVVVLLDGLTRLGRAYHLATPATGRAQGTSLDVAALYAPKRFFGAARNIENGGSLTILATVVVESGSAADEAIFEEVAGAANAEVRLSSELAEHGVVPAIDPTRSGTRHLEAMLGADEVAVLGTVRGALAGLAPEAAAEQLVERLRGTGSNAEFLLQVQRAPAGSGLGR